MDLNWFGSEREASCGSCARRLYVCCVVMIVSCRLIDTVAEVEDVLVEIAVEMVVADMRVMASFDFSMSETRVKEWYGEGWLILWRDYGARP